MPTRDELSEEIRHACRDWVEVYGQDGLSIRSLLLGCEQRLCELLSMPRPDRPAEVDHVAFGNGRNCGAMAHQRLAKKLGGGAPSMYVRPPELAELSD